MTTGGISIYSDDMAFMDLYDGQQNLKEVIIYFIQDGVSSSKEMLQAFSVIIQMCLLI